MNLWHTFRWAGRAREPLNVVSLARSFHHLNGNGTNNLPRNDRAEMCADFKQAHNTPLTGFFNAKLFMFQKNFKTLCSIHLKSEAEKNLNECEKIKSLRSGIPITTESSGFNSLTEFSQLTNYLNVNNLVKKKFAKTPHQLFFTSKAASAGETLSGESQSLNFVRHASSCCGNNSGNKGGDDCGNRDEPFIPPELKKNKCAKIAQRKGPCPAKSKVPQCLKPKKQSKRLSCPGSPPRAQAAAPAPAAAPAVCDQPPVCDQPAQEEAVHFSDNSGDADHHEGHHEEHHDDHGEDSGEGIPVFHTIFYPDGRCGEDWPEASHEAPHLNNPQPEFYDIVAYYGTKEDNKDDGKAKMIQVEEVCNEPIAVEMEKSMECENETISAPMAPACVFHSNAAAACCSRRSKPRYNRCGSHTNCFSKNKCQARKGCSYHTSVYPMAQEQLDALRSKIAIRKRFYCQKRIEDEFTPLRFVQRDRRQENESNYQRQSNINLRRVKVG